MSTRFHDKWHGANHQSASANGVPDSARDPIASYVFPFNGEFIMNNSPRASGYSNGEWSGQLDSWILSSDKVDARIIRAQQDDPLATVVVSARHGGDSNYVVETDTGSLGNRTVSAFAGAQSVTVASTTGANTVVTKIGNGTRSVLTGRADKLDSVVESGGNRVEAMLGNDGGVRVYATSGILASADQQTRMSRIEGGYATESLSLSAKDTLADSSSMTHIGSLGYVEVVSPNVFVNGSSNFAENGYFTADRITLSSNGVPPTETEGRWYPEGEIVAQSGYFQSPRIRGVRINGTSGYFNYLSAVSADVTRMNVHISELSGYIVSGSDHSVSPPLAEPEAALRFHGTGIWSDSWMRLSGDAAFMRNVGVSGDEVVGGDLTVGGSEHLLGNLDVGMSALFKDNVTVLKDQYVSGGVDVGPGGVWTEGMLESSGGIATSGDALVSGVVYASGVRTERWVDVGTCVDFVDTNHGIAIYNGDGDSLLPHRGSVVIGQQAAFEDAIGPVIAIGPFIEARGNSIVFGQNARVSREGGGLAIQFGDGDLQDDDVTFQIEDTPIVSGWKFNRELYDFYFPTARSNSALWVANPFFESPYVSADQEVVRDAIGIGSGAGAPVAVYGRSDFDSYGRLVPAAAANVGAVIIGEGARSSISDAIAIGAGASVTAPSHPGNTTIQIGSGTNSGFNGGLQVNSYPLLGWDGQIPVDRFPMYGGGWEQEPYWFGRWNFSLVSAIVDLTGGENPSEFPVFVATYYDGVSEHHGEGWISGICTSAANLLYNAVVGHADTVYTATTVNTGEKVLTATDVDYAVGVVTATSATTVTSAGRVSAAELVGSAHSVTSAWNATVVGSAQAVGMAAYVGSATKVESVYEVETVMGNAGSVGSAGEVTTAETVSTAGQVKWTSYVGSALDVESADSVVYVGSALSIGASAFNTYLYETLAEGATAVPLDINRTLYRLAMPSTPTAGTYTYPVIDYTGIGNADGTIYAFRMEIEVPADAVAFSPQTGGTGQQMDQWDWISEFPDPSVCSGKTVYIAAELDCAATARTVTANTWRVK